MLIADMIRRAALLHKDAPLIVAGPRTISYSEFDEATNRCGNALLDAGLARGDRVALNIADGPDYLIASHAAARAGLVQVPLNARETEQDHQHKLADSGARALLGDAVGGAEPEIFADADGVRRLIADGAATVCDASPAEGDVFRLSYTGGTTGPAKAVASTNRQKTAEFTHLLMDLMPDLRAGDKLLHAAPLTHASGAFFLPALLRGACNVLLPGFRPGDYLEAVERHRPAFTFLVPTMLAMLLDDPGSAVADVSSLRAVLWSASPMPRTVSEGSRRLFGEKLRGTYGQSEAPMALTLLREDEQDRIGSAGRPYTLAEVRVVDDEDREVAPGEPGEVVARGDIVMPGYWNRPEQTADTLRGGWLHTGDVGRVDEEGYLYLLDRKNDVIITGGFNVYPHEVEEALLAHPAVREAAVVGTADDQWGEAVEAVVSVREQVDPDALRTELKARLAGFKVPKRITVAEELPKSAAGKILRRTVRDRVLSGGNA